jgi:tetratricopeptide (TPR) repeat protein
MAVNLVNSEFVSYIESLIRPSVVLVIVDGESSRTGFFVSRDGVICTCFHGPSLYLHDKVKVSVRCWDGRTYPANVIFSYDRADLVLLAVQDLSGPHRKTQPLPISSEPPPTSRHRHDAASLGYAGLETYGTLKEPKMPVGELTVKYDYNEHQERFEIYGISSDKGNSGAPVMDLQRLRVLGYVQSSYEATGKRIGHALTFKALLREHPELITDWRRSCQEFDLALARYYAEKPFHIDLQHCPRGLISGLVSTHIADVFESHRDKELFELNRYAPRAVETELINYLEESTSNLLLLSGASGSGKTSFLLNLTQRLDRKRYLPVFIRCKGLKVGNLLQTGFNTLLPIEHYELALLGQLLDRCPERKWVLFFDGLNECAGFSKTEFRELVKDLRSLTETRGQRLKVVFSLRTEFLREYLPTFFWQGARQDTRDADLLQFFQDDDRGRPYIRIGRINKLSLRDGRLELKAMYEQYGRTGLKPTTTFEQLSEPILKMLDRPFVLNLMMETYNGAEIPLSMGRSDLMREIIDRTLEKAGIERQTEVGRMKRFLSKLAAFILRSDGDLSCLDSDLEGQTWYKGDYLDKLLADTPFLERETILRRPGNENLIRFGADWTFEFFIASYLSEEWWHGNPGKNLKELLAELHLLLPQKEVNLQHLLIALLFFAEWAVTDDPSRFSFLVTVMNDSEHSLFAKGLIRESLDFFRITYGLSQKIPSYDGSYTTILDLLSRNADHFGETGGEGLLDYVEYLEEIDKYTDALALLNTDACRRAVEGSSQLRARRQLCLALSSCLNQEIDAALSYANEVEVGELPPELRAKHAFVVGRVYQYKEDFTQAESAYEIGRQVSSLYGYRCEHQLAFIKVVAESDFVAALALAERTIENSTFSVSPELKFGSRLLKATCLFRIGRYREAEGQLSDVIKVLGGKRNKNRLGKVLRVLGEAQSRMFACEAAIDTIEKAIEALRDSPPLSLAAALDTKANIVGLLAGKLKEARDCNRKSLELSQGKGHRGTRQWCLQTSALLSALEGDLDDTERFLEEAGADNPYEKLLRRFIHLLALHRAGKSSGAGFETMILRLRDDFEGLRLAWYPEMLSLIRMAASGATPNREKVAALFSSDVNLEGVFNSHLYAQIFAVP